MLQVLGPALWVTCKLMLASFVVAVLLAFVLGVAAALRPGGVIDSIVSLFAFAGISVPVFWLALVMILLFAVQLHWLPASGLSTVGDGSLRDQLRHLLMPVITLALASTGQFTRFVRAAMVETMRMDHVRTARAKGAGEGRIVLVHALRNALIPVVTVMALSFGSLFSGALVTETMFAQPGNGQDDLRCHLGQRLQPCLDRAAIRDPGHDSEQPCRGPRLQMARSTDKPMSAVSTTQRAVSPWRLRWRRFCKHRTGMASLVVLFLLLVFALAAWPTAKWLGVDPYETDLFAQYGPPSVQHPAWDG